MWIGEEICKYSVNLCQGNPGFRLETALFGQFVGLRRRTEVRKLKTRAIGVVLGLGLCGILTGASPRNPLIFRISM